ncbi:MAG: TetR/AcrR family transcriptional regulator [Velocimicrobium sp.]
MDKKKKILNAVDILFTDKGYNLSMSDIAKDVGIKVPSIYSHYTGKDEIIFLVVEKKINHFYDFIFEEMKKTKDKSFEESLKILFYLVINYFNQKNRLHFWRNISLIQNSELKKTCEDLIRLKEKILYEKLYMIFIEGKDEEKINYVNLKGIVSLTFVLVKGVMDTMIVYQNSDIDLQSFFDEIWNEYWFSIKK